jgi:hypothetical protein
MTSKRPDSFEEFQRKRAAQRASELPPTSHNEPSDLPSLSHEELTYVEAAREALVTVKRTFEFWIVVARGLRTLKDKADRIGGRFTFDRLREREGLGGRSKHGKEVLNKTRVSRLLAILDNLAEVEAWRATLTEKQRFDWASPEAVSRHCPALIKPQEGERKPSPYAQMKVVNIALQEENAQLKRREEGDRFKPTDTADDIATVLVGMFSPTKADEIAKRMLAKLKARPRGKTKAEGSIEQKMEEALKQAENNINRGLGRLFK